MDQSLSFESHISKACAQCTGLLIGISSSRNILSYQAAKALIESLVLSRLLYCCTIWGSCSLYLLQRAQRVQNFAARIATQSPRLSPSKPLLQRLGWLSMN